jgi:hypothetical protein
MFFATREAAVEFLENCHRGGNYMAESYHDRVNAENAIRYFDRWSPAPLPRPSTADIPLKKKPLRRKQTR